MEKSWNCVFEFLREPWTVWNKVDLVQLAKSEELEVSVLNTYFLFV